MWRDARENDARLIAALRADLYNTSSRGFDRTFEAADFLPDAVDHSLEGRVRALIEQGMSPSAAAAAATSRQTPEQKLRVISSGGRKRRRA